MLNTIPMFSPEPLGAAVTVNTLPLILPVNVTSVLF